MKLAKLNRIIAMTLIATLATVLQLPAQEQVDQGRHAKHHHYQVVDMGTFGGPNSYFNSLSLTDAFGFGTVFYNNALIGNRRGTFVGFADTSTPDPYPGFCYTPDCFVAHAFQWRNGVKTDLDSLPHGASSGAFWINHRGWITGNSEDGQTDPLIPGLPEVRAVLWKDGSIQDLGTLGGSESFAQAINDRGQITGLALNGVSDPYSFYYVFLYGFSNGTQTRAFLWDEDEGMQDLGTLGGADAFPSLINQHGQVAGFSYTNSTPNPTTGLPTLHPFLWETGKGMIDLGDLGGTLTASVNGLNERGEVVGGALLPGDVLNHPFLWDGQKLIDLTAAPFDPSGNGEARWINEAGDVIGGARLPVPCDSHGLQTHGFLWSNGIMTDLGGLPATPNSEAQFINSSKQIVGESFTCDFSAPVAFLWENGSIVDLNTLISGNSQIFLYWSTFISDSGEIAAYGSLANGDTHALLLIPCDEEHTGIEGCDYEPVDAAVASQTSTAPVVLAQAAATQPSVTPSVVKDRIRALMLNRSRRFTSLPRNE